MIRLNPSPRTDFSGPPYSGLAALAPEVVRAELGVERLIVERGFRWEQVGPHRWRLGNATFTKRCRRDRHEFELATLACKHCGTPMAAEPVEQPVDHGAERNWPLLETCWKWALDPGGES